MTITFDEKLEAAWGLHKIEKAVLEKEIAELRAENGKFFKQAEMNARLLTENASLRAENEKLRNELITSSDAAKYYDYGYSCARDMQKDEITRLRAENERLENTRIEFIAMINKLIDERVKMRKALNPFAATAKHFKDDCKDTLVVKIGVDVGDLRAAAAAIRESGDD